MKNRRRHRFWTKTDEAIHLERGILNEVGGKVMWNEGEIYLIGVIVIQSSYFTVDPPPKEKIESCLGAIQGEIEKAFEFHNYTYAFLQRELQFTPIDRAIASYIYKIPHWDKQNIL